MIKIDLWPQQQEASRLCQKYTQYLINIDPGGGKTLAALDVFDKLYLGEKIPRVIICPKSALDAWKTDIQNFTDFTFSINNFRDEVFLNIYTFPNLEELFDIFKNNEKSGILIIDEAHMLCSADSKQSGLLRGKWVFNKDGRRKFCGLLDSFNNKYGFSATMMKNNIDSVYYLVISFFPGFFNDLESFLNFYTERITRKTDVWDPKSRRRVSKYYKEIIKYKNLDHLENKLKKILYRYSIDYGQKIFKMLIELPENEMDMYYRVGAGALGKSNSQFVSRLPTLQRIANGSIDEKLRFRSDVSLLEKERQLVKLLNEINERDEGAIVFTQDKECTIRRFDIIKSRLDFKRYYVLTGDTDDFHRSEIRHNLAPQECVFATRAGGVSFNFNAVNNVVFYDMDWDAMNFIQEMGRITRSNSTYTKFNVYVMLAMNTIDEYKWSLTQSCLSLQKKLFGGLGFANLYFAKIKKEMLVNLRKSLLWGMKKSGKLFLTPNVKCVKCNRWSNYILGEFDGREMVEVCYAAFDEMTQSWVEGCAYKNADEFKKRLADKLIKGL